MIKEKTEKKKNLDGLPPILADTSHFECLWCVKGMNFRKVAFLFVNETLEAKRSENCILRWYKYPETIPPKHRYLYVPVLIEGLHEALRSQRNFTELNIKQVEASLSEYKKLKNHGN